MRSSAVVCLFFILVSKPLTTAADRPQGRDDGEGMAGSGKTQQMITSNDAMVTREEFWKKTLKKDAEHYEVCKQAVLAMIEMCNAVANHPECKLTDATVTVECNTPECEFTRKDWDEKHGRPWKDGPGYSQFQLAFTKEVGPAGPFTIWNPACFVPGATPPATDTSGLPMIALANHLSDELAKVNAQVISLEEYTFENGRPNEEECALTTEEFLSENSYLGFDTLDLVTRAKKMSLMVKVQMGKLYCLELAIDGEGKERPKDVAAEGVGPLLAAIAHAVGRLNVRAVALKNDVIGESGAL